MRFLCKSRSVLHTSNYSYVLVDAEHKDWQPASVLVWYLLECDS